MTDKYAVIGNPIAHSKSPLIHRMFAEQTGQDISYEAILAPLDGFAATIEQLHKEGYKGCNVTVPFKFDAFELATELSERAQAAQAVNTLKFDGKTILGDNTDGAGLVADIERNLGISLHGKHVLLMGAGGAAYGVSLPLLGAGVALTIVNRTLDKADMLRQHLSSALKNYSLAQQNDSAEFNPATHLMTGLLSAGRIHSCGYPSLQGRHFDIIINATSASLATPDGLFGFCCTPDLPKNIFALGALAYDMMYGRETPFMKFAREHGAAVVADGLGMLVEQAAEAFFIWRGVRPDTVPVIAALRT
ncbi:MAG TPA: shikimate dehydrogenase [Gallionella sp.]|nr:shikimate dehydrogenase [Gallionella sp.]